MGKLRLNVFVTPKQSAWLHKRKTETGLAVSDIIRRAVEEYMKRHCRPEKITSEK